MEYDTDAEEHVKTASEMLEKLIVPLREMGFSVAVVCHYHDQLSEQSWTLSVSEGECYALKAALLEAAEEVL